MKKPKNIIFDCDGVLVDSEIIANRIEVEVKNELGFPITLEEQISKFVGHGMTTSVMQEELSRLPESYNSIVDERCKIAYLQELKSIQGVTEVLQSLAHPKCVASSSRSDWLDYKLTLTDLKPFFKNSVFSGDMVKKCKPAPDLFLYAIETMGWSASDCLVIEDSVAGVTAAKAAGILTCGFIGGSHIFPGHSEKLLAAGADYIIKDITMVINLLE
jgi:HAD superfamily hydrolase (TIGR01509 family)